MSRCTSRESTNKLASAVRYSDGGWEIEIKDRYMPRCEIMTLIDDLHDLLADTERDEDKEFLARKMAQVSGGVADE